MSQSNNNSFNRNFFVLGGATMTSGYSLNLAKGQVGIFSLSAKNATKDGLQAVSTFAGRPVDEDFVIKAGRGPVGVTRSTSNKAFSSVPFSLKDVKKVSVSAPQSTEQKVDDVILGYNGNDASTAINLIRADRKKITVELSGEAIGLLGYPDNKVVTSVYLDPEKYNETDLCSDGDNCEAVNARPYVLEAIEELRRYQLRGGVTMDKFVDITPVEASEGGIAPVTTNVYFQTLNVLDMGDQASLALVQAEFPNNVIERIGRVGMQSVYQTVTANNTPLADYEVLDASFIKGCDDCPDGYNTIDAGFVYSVTLEDDGVDSTTSVDDLPGFVTGTAVKIGQKDGVGSYLVVLDDELTAAEIATFIGTNALKSTAKIKLLGDVKGYCEATNTTDFSWVVGDACEVSTQAYDITLADDECGNNRLAELQAHYPNATITLAPSDSSTRTVTLTGTAGTANINVNGTNYLATFATDLATTAANWVSTNAGTILTAAGLTATANGAVITFAGLTEDFTSLSVTNATSNLAGTVGALTVVPVTSQGCQTRYRATVGTNMVCDECSDVFKDFFVSEAPAPYDGNEWVAVTTAQPTTSLMGIRFRGKKLEVRSNEYLRDKIGFTDSSVQIRVSGGHLDEVRSGIGELKDEPMAVTYLQRWEPRTHMGGNLQWIEARDHVYFTGEEPHMSAMTRTLFTQEESVIDQSAQYVDYVIHICRKTLAQQPSLKHEEEFDLHIHAPAGKHQSVEDLVNSIAGAAGLPGVSALGV